ncbi:hypothetical protein JTB14_007575 [Gonioctena quinquepunctata]|nr:hypothetical protein JTB14_007575 [Gonioctena quinquepunctata]
MVRINQHKTLQVQLVEKFGYLGTLFAKKTELEEEIKMSLAAGNKRIHAIQNFIRSKLISRHVRDRDSEEIRPKSYRCMGKENSAKNIRRRNLGKEDKQRTNGVNWRTKYHRSSKV